MDHQQQSDEASWSLTKAQGRPKGDPAVDPSKGFEAWRDSFAAIVSLHGDTADSDMLESVLFSYQKS